MAQAFRRTALDCSSRVAVRTLGDEISWTWGELRERVDDTAAGLHSLGIGRGDCVALMLTNRPEFYQCDLAAMMLGATTLSVYQTYAPDQIAYVLADSAARVVITERRFLNTVLTALADMPSVEHVVLVDDVDNVDNVGDVGQVDLDQLRELGRATSFDVEAAVAALAADTVLTLIYTSGTTGQPKGVELTHANMVAAVATITGRHPLSAGSRVISWLPTAHIAERLAHLYLPISHGLEVTCCPDPRQIGEYLPAVQPTWFFAVPRVWEKLKSGLEAALAALPEREGELARAALAASTEKVRLEQAGQPVPEQLAADVARADAAIFAGPRRRIGFGELAQAHVGAAPVAVEVLEFFHAIGVPLAEVWGMSETCGVGTFNPPERIRIGTVGLPETGMELRLADDGEILVRGEAVMRGYRNNPSQTAETVVDGWLHTGDIGTIDGDGYVRIVDRKKELIINMAGKNMSPAFIEARLKAASPLIGQACCIGDGRPYNTALIVLDADLAPVWAANQGIAGSDLATLAADERVRKQVQLGVDAANSQLSRPERIKKFYLVPGDWQPAGDELTPTMKLRRRPIEAKYRAEIEAMYSH